MRGPARSEQPFDGLRLMGKTLLAVGFVTALYAVNKPDPIILNVSLGVLATGIALLAAGLYRRIRLRRGK